MGDFALLQIVKGIPRVASDDLYSLDIESIDLLDVRTFSVADGGWIPQFPQLKNGGIAVESALEDGRILIAGGVGNVTETLTLTSTAATVAGRAWLQARLHKFAQLGLEFHTTLYQIDPVYLVVQLIGEPGPRYALIYNISVAQNNEAFGSGSVDQLSISIEREPYWRGLPPGQSPKLWALEQSETTPTYDEAIDFLDSDSTVYETIQNKTEYSSLSTLELETQNFLKVPAASIPGDAPTLTYIKIDVDDSALNPEGLDGYFNRFIVGRYTKPPVARSDLQDLPNLCLSAGDGEIQDVDDTSLVIDTGGVKVFNEAFDNGHVEIDFATDATMIDRFKWGANAGRSVRRLLRGNFAVFARAGQIGGSAGDINMQLRLGGTNQFIGATYTTEPVSPTVTATVSSASTLWPVTYMGEISWPVDVRAEPQDQKSMQIQVQAERTTGVGVLAICDLWLVPVDEPSADAKTTRDVPEGSASGIMDLDSTGYIGHGERLLVARDEGGTMEVRGQPITLLPGVDNYIYVWGLNKEGRSVVKETVSLEINIEIEIGINIVPRWHGVRDV